MKCSNCPCDTIDQSKCDGCVYSKPSLGSKIIDGLKDFSDALEGGDCITDNFKVTKVISSDMKRKEDQ